MNKEDLKSLVHKEVFFPYGEKANVIKRIWCKYIRPESNAVYLIRKYQYCMNGNSIKGNFMKLNFLKDMVYGFIQQQKLGKDYVYIIRMGFSSPMLR